MNWNLYNVLMLGISFMFVFTAFQTCQMIQETVLEGAKNGTFKGSGYTSLCIIYGVFAASNWVAPSIVAVCGAKISMIIGGMTYTLFIASFLKPMVWSLYSASALIGVGAAFIWTGQGNFLTVNSDSSTIARNSGIFWALLQCSLVFGNIYVYFAFHGEPSIDDHTRLLVYTVLSCVCGAGVLCMLFLRSSVATDTQLNVNQQQTRATGPVSALVDSFKLLATKEMALLTIVFAYTGLEMTFWAGVYGTSVGHTTLFDNPKSLQGLTGILIGVGEILGGLLFGILGKKTNKYGRDPVILLGFIVHTVAFYLTFLNLPPTSPFSETSISSYFNPPREYVALGCAFLYGFGDSSYNTQIYSLLGHKYSKSSSSAFALYKFVQSLAAATAFFYTQPGVGLLLQYQLLILALTNTLAAIAFFVVEGFCVVENSGYQALPETAVTDDDEERE